MRNERLWIYILLALAGLGLMAMGMPASAQQMQCGPSEQMLDALEKKYGEVPVLDADGPASGSRATLYWNYETGTWTMVMAPSTDIACFAMSGKNMVPSAPQPIKQPKGVRGS